MKKISLAIAFTEKNLKKKAEELASTLNFPLATEKTDYDYLLILSPDFLALQRTKDKKRPPFYIDFLSKNLLYRSKHTTRRTELIVKAMGISSKENATIIDATAGLGRDSFILASFGFKVMMLERSLVLYALLKDALNRSKKDENIAPITKRLTLIHADASKWLSENRAIRPEVIYLDPMFPERKKSALVKKEMVLLQDLIGTDDDAESLLELSLTCATKRVVVKRPRLAPYLSSFAPMFSLSGKSSRFDIYTINK